MQRFLLLAIALIACPAVALASPVVSTSAGTFATAQNVNGNFSTNNIPTIINSTTIPHVEISQNGRPGAGFDYYRFHHDGGRIIVDIDGANFLDTEVGLWRADGTLIGSNDDSWNPDAGDNDSFNSLLGGGTDSTFDPEVNVPAGDYVVGVSQFFSSFQSGSPFITGAQVPQGGTYLLNISAFNSVPEPATLLVFGFGITALGGLGWRKTRTV